MWEFVMLEVLRRPFSGSLLACAVSLSVSLACSQAALAQSGKPAAEPAGGAGAEEVCQRPKFSKFFRSFSQQPDLQRKYTHLPLEYSYLDTDLIGTDQESNATKTRRIEALDEVAKVSGGTIFPPPAKIKKNHWVTEVNTGRRPSGEGQSRAGGAEQAIVTLRGSDDGFRIDYRFQRTDGCWRLHAISDSST